MDVKVMRTCHQVHLHDMGPENVSPLIGATLFAFEAPKLVAHKLLEASPDVT